jgi:hypothetical protein
MQTHQSNRALDVRELVKSLMFASFVAVLASSKTGFIRLIGKKGLQDISLIAETKQS